MATKIYFSNGGINIDDSINDLVVINPVQFDWKISNLSYSVRDKIDNQSYDLGVLADIQNEAGDAFLTKALLESYLNGLINSSIQKTFSQEVSEGNAAGYSFIEKFGENPEIDTASAPADIWDNGIPTSAGGTPLYTFSTSAAIDTISSSNAGDAQLVSIQGLDENWQLVTQTATLAGQTKVVLGTPLIRCFRVFNSGNTDFAGNIWVYEDTAISVGVPTDKTKVRAKITNGNNQTLMCIYTIPAGKTGYFQGGYVTLSRTGNNSAVFQSWIRVFGGVFRIVSVIASVATGASSWQYKYPYPIALPEKTDVLLRVSEVDANDTGVSGGFTILLKDN